MRDSATKKSRGFGFVSFAFKEEVDRAMNARPHEIDGKTVDPKRAVPREQGNRAESNMSTKRLYVSGVRDEHTEQMIEDYFKNYGKVIKAEIITDKNTGKTRGFGFVTFDDYDSVDQCVLQKSHMISGYRCDVKKALSKDDMARAAQLDRDRAERALRSRGGMGPRGGMGGGQWGGPPGRGGYGGGGRDDSAGYGQWGGPQGGWGGQPGGQGWDSTNYGYGYGSQWGAQSQWPQGPGGPQGGAQAGWGAQAQWSNDATQQGGWSTANQAQPQWAQQGASQWQGAGAQAPGAGGAGPAAGAGPRF